MLGTSELNTVLQVESHKGRAEGESLPSNCWSQFLCSPGYSWLSGLQALIAGSHQTFHLPVFPSPSLCGCSPSICQPVFTGVWNCPDPGTGTFTWSCWTLWGRQRPTFRACESPYEWQPFPVSEETAAPLSLVSAANLMCSLSDYFFFMLFFRLEKGKGRQMDRGEKCLLS